MNCAISHRHYLSFTFEIFDFDLINQRKKSDQRGNLLWRRTDVATHNRKTKASEQTSLQRNARMYTFIIRRKQLHSTHTV